MSTKEENKPTQRLSWKKAGNLLSETERNRVCCLLLTCFEQIKPTSEDMELAAAQFGAAKGGFVKMYQTTVKKLKENNAYIIEGETVDNIPGPPTPVKTPKKKNGAAGTKRKTTEENGEGEGGKVLLRLKKARSPKKVKAEEVEAEAGAGAGATTKPKDV